MNEQQRAFAEAYPLCPSNGWLKESEAALLHKSAYYLSGPILEVGCHYGRSSVLLASLGRIMYCVDPWLDEFGGDPVYESWRHTMKPYIHVSRYRSTIEDWTVRFTGKGGKCLLPATFAYLDGDHTYNGTLRQVSAAVWAGARVIAIHDVNDNGEGVRVRDAALSLLGIWKERVDSMAVWDLTK